MKKNIEHIIKESLENHELPYNSEAWSAMSAKLNMSSAASTGSGSSVDSAVKSSLENNSYPYNPQAWDAMSARLDSNAGAGVDQAIKSSLENYELPYAAGAWTALNATLDAKDAPKSNTKWYAAASILIAAATVSYFVINGTTQDSNPKTKTNKIAQTGNDVEVSNTTSNSNQATTTNNTSTTSNSNGETASNNSSNESSTPVIGNETPSNSAFGGNSNHGLGNGNGNGTGNGSGDSDKSGSSGSEDHNELTNNGGSTMEPFVMPTIYSACQGTAIQIANSNEYDMTIIYPNGSIWTGKAQSETTLTATSAGLYKVGYLLNGEMVEEGSFNVHSAPGADFDFDDLGEIWEDGLPTTTVIATTPGSSYEWKYGKLTATGMEADPHFFTKGNHDIELTVTGTNGCKSTITKTVNIEDNYNLFAIKAFDPQDMDVRNSTFMPRALIEREDVKFSMIIIDHTDGHVMFETSDASQGWDGVDRTTGQALGYEKTFIWKVTVENPESGERRVYGDNAIILPRQN